MSFTLLGVVGLTAAALCKPAPPQRGRGLTWPTWALGDPCRLQHSALPLIAARAILGSPTAETWPQTVRATGRGTKSCCSWGVQRAGLRWRRTNTRLLSLTTFHRSLTRESTLRMSACSAPPLIPPVDRGLCPRPQTEPGIRLDGEPCRETQNQSC